MKTVTVNELMMICKKAVKDGFGDKKILVSNDDEGNGFHELFYHFTSVESYKRLDEEWGEGTMDSYMPFGVSSENIDEYIILG